MNVVKSLTGHRKDTFTLFIIYVVSIVTVFVFISFFNSSYETVKSINETVNVDIYLKNDVNNSYSSQFVETCDDILETCLLYTSPSPRDLVVSRMPSSA